MEGVSSFWIGFEFQSSFYNIKSAVPNFDFMERLGTAISGTEQTATPEYPDTPIYRVWFAQNRLNTTLLCVQNYLILYDSL